MQFAPEDRRDRVKVHEAVARWRERSAQIRQLEDYADDLRAIIKKLSRKPH